MFWPKKSNRPEQFYHDQAMEPATRENEDNSGIVRNATGTLEPSFPWFIRTSGCPSRRRELCWAVRRKRRMAGNPSPLDRRLATQILLAGVVATVLCFLTSQIGFVSRFALVLAPSLLLIGMAGLLDTRILQAALRKPGESISHLPRWAVLVGYACWSPTVVLLAYLVFRFLSRIDG